MKSNGFNRNFLLLIQGQFVSNVGNQVFDIAMLLWIKEMTGSAAVMGVAMLLTSLPEVLLAPFGGKLSDRYGRLRTIILSDFISAAAVGTVLLAIWFNWEPELAIIALVFCNVVLGLSAACFGPAVSAIVPTLITEQNLTKGNAIHQFSRVGGRMLGQSLGGLLFSVIGVGGTFLINACSFLASAISETRIKLPPKQVEPRNKQQDAPLIKQTFKMLGMIWQDRKMRALLIYIAIFHLCLSCLPILLPFYAEHVLAIDDIWFGLFVAIYTLGIMLGFILAGLIQYKERYRLIAKAGALVGVLFFGVAYSSSTTLSSICLLGIGMGIGVIIVNLMTELQLKSPEQDRAGIMGAAQAIGGSSLPVGMALSGLLLDSLHFQGVSYEAAMQGILLTSAVLSVFASITALLKDNALMNEYQTR